MEDEGVIQGAKKTSQGENIIEKVMMEMLTKRGRQKTCCPSEVARKVCPEDWRRVMEDTRDVARRMADCGLIDICQRGEVVTGTQWKGPIRLRLR